MFGGCLGAERRRRTCYAAISRGELRRSFDPRISEWGNPPSIARTPRSQVLVFDQKWKKPDREVLDFWLSREGMRLPNKIGGFKQTQGTETSKYLEERTSTETPLVVASERGPGQWPGCKNGNDLEKSAIVGDSPVPVESILVLE